jgi:hypothetical protein
MQLHLVLLLLAANSCGLDPLRELIDRYERSTPKEEPSPCGGEVATAVVRSLEGRTYSAAIGDPTKYGNTLRIEFVDSKSTLRSRVQTDVLFNGAYRIVANCVEITEPNQPTSYLVLSPDAATLTEVKTGLVYRELPIYRTLPEKS